MLKTRIRKWCLLLLLLGCCMGVQAQYSMGNTGLLNIPTADMQKAGTFMGGGNYLPNGMTPFNFNTGNYFVNITFLSFLELSYRCTLLKTTRYDGKKGYFQQDRSLSARIRPIEEGKYHPRIGIQRDFIFRSLSEQEQNAFNKLYDQYYYHRHNEFWRQQAMKKLPQLTQSTRMLVCGEDLGMIPDCVPSVMNDLRILSLEIQRMPKNPMHEFGYLNEYPYRSVCTISTHDMSTLRGWWEEDYLQTQRYYNTMLGHYGTAPTVATPELCEEIVRNHLKSNSILCILSLQDWLSIDGKWRNPNVQEERINVPSNPRNYWRYRMHLTLEQLMKAKGLNDKIRELIKYTGRAPKK